MNKTLKKTLSIILTILMIVTTIPFALAAGDGVPLTIDVTDKTSVIIGDNEYYYDEDGYILTGAASGWLEVRETCNVTLNNVAASRLDLRAPDNSVINIAFDGTNGFVGRISLMREHLVFEGSYDATVKASYFYNGGNSDSTVTVNGGNMVLETVAESQPTINCGNFIINDGTVTASNDSYYVIGSPVKLNGGELNIISTSADYAAIDTTVTMKKGALLTVSAAGGILSDWYGTNIVMTDDAAENDTFFVRYDAESEFVPVYDIKTALDGKTYAEIKIDTHEHSLENGKCDACGYACPHENVTDGVCDACSYVCTHESYTDGKCDVCEYECPHTETEEHLCIECGKTTECTDENSDLICDVCNALLDAPEISVGGIYVNGDNYTDILGDADEGATAYYIPETNTLVLDGFNYEGEDYGIGCDGSLNIEVKGENRIVAGEGLNIYAIDDAVINIGGTGKLDIVASSNGIYADSYNEANIEINIKDSVTLNIDSEDDGMDIDGEKANKITVSENGALNIKAVSEGITVSELSESVEILVKDNGTLTVDGEDECIYIFDTAKAAVTFTDNAKVSLVNNDEEGIYISALESGIVTVSENADVYIDVEEQSVEAETVIVDGGSLKAYSKKTYDAIVAADVTVNAGKLIVSSEDDYAISADSIKISGGTLVASNSSAEYPVFSVTPDFSEYTSEHMVLASEKADADYLVEYDSDNAENYRVIAIQCKHELDGNVCKKCGFECGVDCGHYLEEGAVCAICSSYVYAITHQPTEAEPYVGLSDDTNASYQWYTVEENISDITDENATTVSYTWGESSYDKETGWTGVPYAENHIGHDFFTVELKAGETLTVEVTGDFVSGVGLYDYETEKDIWKDAQEGVVSYELTVESDGNYTFYTNVNSGVVTVKSYKATVDEPAIDGENAAELKNPIIGNKYFCEVTFADGTTEMSDKFEVTHLHTFTKYEVTEEAECGKEGKKVAFCDYGCGKTDEKEIPALTHSFTKHEETEAPECGKAGKEVAACDNGCGKTDEKEIPALTHKDDDGDYKCDHGCGHEFQKPVEPDEPDTPDTPDEPSDGECDHICHNSPWFIRIFWEIVNLFYRIFRINQYCSCGALHYSP